MIPNSSWRGELGGTSGNGLASLLSKPHPSLKEKNPDFNQQTQVILLVVALAEPICSKDPPRTKAVALPPTRPHGDATIEGSWERQDILNEAKTTKNFFHHQPTGGHSWGWTSPAQPRARQNPTAMAVPGKLQRARLSSQHSRVNGKSNTKE